jgi:hypothetical protein
MGSEFPSRICGYAFEEKIIMTYHSVTATFEEGAVVLPPDVDWPNGTKLQIQPIQEQPRTWADIMKDYTGIADDMPSDLAMNHDHYLHGAPKK